MASPKQQRTDRPTVAPKSSTASSKQKSGRPGGRPPKAPKIAQATARDWISGARIQTLPLAFAPVALGTAAAYVLPHEADGAGWHWLRALLCLIVAVSLQIAVNFANDYSDGVRGTDANRVGPRRLTGSGAAKPRTVITVAAVWFGIAAVAGLIIVVRSGHWWMLAVGAAAILAAYFYTGGKRPYGYSGWGELFVFVFFGLVATAGTTFVLSGTVTVESWLAAVAVGLFAVATLMVNNIRDIQQDAQAGKRTLAVLLGNVRSRIFYVVAMLVPFAILGAFTLLYVNAYLVFFVLLVALPACVIVLTAKTASELILALRLTGITALFFGLGLASAIAF
ncbi:MAG: 1,4-dihydroxy-2-naphthoate polyprenyltransferase [Rhodoglobus sp.]